MRVVIIGGGFIGQLIQLMIPKSRCLDWNLRAPEMANRQLGAQYLWEPLKELPCRRFEVITSIDGEAPTETSILNYKKKVGKEHDQSDWSAQFRRIMPGYEVLQMPPSRVEYNMRIVSVNTERRQLTMTTGAVVPYDVLISTVPLPFMAKHVGKIFNPQSQAIYVRSLPSSLPGDEIWTVNYRSDPNDPVYRTTVRNGIVHWESIRSMDPDGWRRMIPGKIYKHPDAHAVRDALAANDIYCFGRFARWEPEELAHETLRLARAFIRHGGWA